MRKRPDKSLVGGGGGGAMVEKWAVTLEEEMVFSGNHLGLDIRPVV